MARKSTGLDLFRSLFREIRKKDPLKQIYYLFGEETFLKEYIQKEIEKLIPEEQKDFNFDLFYGNESESERIIEVARSFPMMAERRVVIVKDFLKLQSASASGLIPFQSYIENPNPYTILCLIDTKLPDGRSEPGKTLRKKSKSPGGAIGVYEFQKIPDPLLPEWVIDWTRHTHKMTIEPRAAQILSQLVGQDLQLLSTEIEKLCTFVDSDSDITLDHIKKITESYRDYNVIELKEAVISRDLDKALHISEQILQKSNSNAGEVIKTVGFFYSVFSSIWQITRLMEQGLNRSEIQSRLGLEKSYAFRYQYQDAQNFRFSEMPRIFESLLDADRAAKGFSTLDDSTIFLMLIQRIIG